MQLIFMYVMGHAVRRLQLPQKMNFSPLIVIYLITSVLSMVMGQIPYIKSLGVYNNPVDVLKSVAVFCIFMKFSFRSKWINYIAGCVFSCYLLQEGALGQTIYGLQYKFWKHIQSATVFLLFSLCCTIAIFLVALVMEPFRKKWMNRFIEIIYSRFHLEKVDII